ncbi:hypothetical protein PWT90_02599 [Aphanocladium album]|nr:hypothetical protein PWT90_02599 [Aphanocladium album]
MRFSEILAGTFVYALIATALPIMTAERSISPHDLINILSKVVVVPRQSANAGEYSTGVPGGEYDDPDPPGDDNDDDDGDVIPEAFLESDVDAGGESAVGNDAVGVASGLTGQGGAGSSALNNQTQGSTSVFCSLFACASASQSDGQVSTTAGGAHINATGPLIQIQGPLISIYASRKSMSNIYNSTATQ